MHARFILLDLSQLEAFKSLNLSDTLTIIMVEKNIIIELRN